MPRRVSAESAHSMEWEPELELELDPGPEMEQLEPPPPPSPPQKTRLAEELVEEGELTDSDPEEPRPHSRSRTRTRTQKFLFDVNEADAMDMHSSFNNTDLIAMEKRANRFGLDKKSDVLTLDKELQQLYHTLNIINDDDVRHAQFDTIHIRGTEKMNTNDVFEYFFTHRPLFLEWVDENSCNVVWKDNISAARAMIFYSKAIKYDDDPEVMDESDEIFINNIWNDALPLAKIPVTIPVGRWRAGAPHPKSEYIFVRFGNKSDKKLSESEKLKIISKKYENSDDVDCEVGKFSESMKSKIKSAVLLQEDEKTKNPWGDLCKTWGINDSQEVFVDSSNIVARRMAPIVDPTRKNVKDRIGTIPVHQRLTLSKDESQSNNIINRLGKRNKDQRETNNSNTEDEDEHSSSDEEWRSKSKVPRMRMHADDEEKKMAKTKDTPISDQKNMNPIIVEVKNEALSDVDSESSDVKETFRSNVSQNRRKAADRDTKSNVYLRLGNRRYSSESDSDEHENSTRGRSSVINKVQSNNRQKSTVASTVWSRLDFVKNRAVLSETEEDDSENENCSDLRNALSKTIIEQTSDKQDLRERIQKKRSNQRSPLRIEVTNELYSDRM
ncbi:uncharacterized protein LOC143920654 [Arctopsyche grandis]|uniref:uncharacterized protein LOC143920654 n=1 Tax=Arctopsyche grandis TaxID=121162 RepID=UPI00406D76AC